MHDSNIARTFDALLPYLFVFTCLALALFVACDAVWMLNVTGSTWMLGASAVLTVALGVLSYCGYHLIRDELGL